MHVMIHTRGTPFVAARGARARAVPTPFLKSNRRTSPTLASPRPPHPFVSVSASRLSVVLHFNLFTAFHVLHSCAAMSPNPWPRPDAAVADVGARPTLALGAAVSSLKWRRDR